MYFYPKLDEKKYPYSSKLISKIYNKKNFFKPDYQDFKISKEIIDYYHQLKQINLLAKNNNLKVNLATLNQRNIIQLIFKVQININSPKNLSKKFFSVHKSSQLSY